MNKEIEILEREIDSIDDIKEWSQKISKMKELKDKIINQKLKMNTLLESLNSNEVKKPKKKNLNLDQLLIDYEESDNLEDKVKLFNNIQYLIKESELELFE
jgi:hypothetical protein